MMLTRKGESLYWIMFYAILAKNPPVPLKADQENFEKLLKLL